MGLNVCPVFRKQELTLILSSFVVYAGVSSVWFKTRHDYNVTAAAYSKA
jgi:hypothetical protein